jgi:MoaA/NifB/PqqE/SkfB family radical SAM enzyme
MIPVRDKRVIQVEITNACINECANCSRFVGHHKKPFYMDLETIEKAIDSLEGFQQIIGIMGGEPTKHPDFSEICKLIQKKIPKEKIHLWTAGYKWDQYRSIISKTFGVTYYNDHKDLSQEYHPMLLAVEDVVPNQELADKLIDACWVDQMWSASITPKGCFFCEIAAAQDIL